MYKEDEGMNINFQILSNHPLFEDSVFFAMKDPPIEMFQGLKEDMLPNIGVIPKLDPEFKEGNINQSNIDASITYEALLMRVAHDTGKLDELRNPTTVKETKKRNFGEITSFEEF